MKTGTIYMVKNLVNGKAYIGRDVKYPKRPHEHLAEKSPACKAIHRAIKKYGADSFVYGAVEVGIPLDSLDEREVYWIAHYETFDNGYNLAPGGEGAATGENNPMFGKAPWNKGKKFPEYSGENNWMYGRTGENHPCFGKKRPDIAEWNRQHKGEKHPNFGKSCPEHSKRMKGNKNAKGHKRTEAQKSHLYGNRNACKNYKSSNLQLKLF